MAGSQLAPDRDLLTFLAAAERARFRWGTFDCCLFAADWCRHATGVDIAAYFRGRYTTKAEGYALLRDYAGGGIKEAIARAAVDYRMHQVPVTQARRGDVAAVEWNREDFLGIVDVGKVLIASIPAGTIGVDLHVDARVYRLPLVA